MTNGVYDPYLNASVNRFINTLIVDAKKYRPTIFVDVIPVEYFTQRIEGKIKLQLKGIPDFKEAMKNDELSVDEFATSLASKIQVSREIFADYILFHNLPRNLLDTPIKKIDELLADCEKKLQNEAMVHADVYYNRFSDMKKPIEQIKKSIQDALRLKKLIATDENDLAIHYVQELIDLIDFSLKELNLAPLKLKPTDNVKTVKR